MSIENKLIGPASVVAGAGWALHVFKTMNREYFPIISHHIGDFNLVLAPIFVSGVLGIGIEKIGEKANSRFLKRIGEYLPGIVSSGLATYFTLGESVFDIIPGNTKDLRDIPAVLLAAGSGYILTRYFRKK